MKKKAPKKLTLHRETLTQLDLENENVAGGVTATCGGCQFSGRQTCGTCVVTCTSNFC